MDTFLLFQSKSRKKTLKNNTQKNVFFIMITVVTENIIHIHSNGSEWYANGIEWNGMKLVVGRSKDGPHRPNVYNTHS